VAAAGEVLIPRPFLFQSLEPGEGTVHLIPVSLGNSLTTSHYRAGFDDHGGITEDVE